MKNYNSKFKIIFILTIFLVVLLLPKISWAATYYIDYENGLDSNSGTSKSGSWQRCPGMKGFSGSYSHSAGDTFIFKGNVTWPYSTLPLIVTHSGSSGNPDSYTVDQTWYVGDSWGRPILDGGQALGKNSYLIGDNSTGQSNILIDGLQLQNIGSPDDGSGTCIQFISGSGNIEVRNCWLEPVGIQAFAYSTVNNNASKIYFHHNYIRKAGRVIVYGRLGTVVDDVRVYNNDWQGPGHTYLGSYHRDGFMAGNPIESTCTAATPPTVTNILIYNNYFYGDWSTGATAQYYAMSCTGNTTIYNNVFAYENTHADMNPFFSPALVAFGPWCRGNINIYNNTFSNDAYPGYGNGGKGAIMVSYPAGGNLVIKGNIFSNIGNDIIYTAGLDTVSIDYNLHNTAGGGRLVWQSSGSIWECRNIASCQANGMETHSPAMADPMFVAIPNGDVGSGNWQLQSASPARDSFPAEQAPTGIFTTDILGVLRPQGSAWDIGAYEYVQAAPPPDTTPPNPPTGVVVQ